MNADERERMFDAARRVLLSVLPQVWALYAYGSVARGDDFPRSDLDLALLLPPGEHLLDPLSLISELSTAAGREVDLVDLRRADDILRREVLASGILLYTNSPDELLAWEAEALSRYARHREDISGILQDMKRTGIGYAQ